MRFSAILGLLILNGCNEAVKPNIDTADSDTDTTDETNTETDIETDLPIDTGIDSSDSATDSGIDTVDEPATVTIIDASTYDTVMDAIAAANTGDTVYLPAETYIIDETFELKTGVNLLGDKQDRAILKTVDGEALKITQHGVNNVTVSHIHFENIHFLFSEQSDFYNKITNLTFRHCLFDKGTLDPDWDDTYFSVVRTKDVVVEYCEFLRDNPDEGGRGVGIYLGRNTIVRDSYFGTTRDLTQAHEHGYFKTAINVNGHNVVSDQVYRSEDIRLHRNTLRRHDDPNIPSEYQDHMIYAWGYDGLTLTHNKGEGWDTTASGGLKLRNGDHVIAYRNRLRDSGFLTYSYDNGNHTYPEHFIDAVLMGNRIDLDETTEECTSNYCGIIYWRNFGDRCDQGLEDNISIMDNYFVDGGVIKVSSSDAYGFCSSGNVGNDSDNMNNVCNTIQTNSCQPDSWTHYATGVYAGDFNGDEIEDFVLWQDNTWQVHESTGHGFTTSDWGSDLNPSYETFRHEVHVLDVNGDNYDDLVYRGLCSGAPCFRVHLSDGSTFSSGQNWGTTASFSSNSETFNYGMIIGDFNGDGNEDLLYRGSDSNSDHWIVQRSTGTEFVPEIWSDVFWEGEQTRDFGVVVGNFDGDPTDRDDIAYRGECNGDPCFVVHLSDGTTFSGPNNWGNNYYSAQYTKHLSLFVGDYNNDGKDDLGYRGKCGTGDHKWRFHKSDGQTFTVNNCSYYNQFDDFNDPN